MSLLFEASKTGVKETNLSKCVQLLEYSSFVLCPLLVLYSLVSSFANCVLRLFIFVVMEVIFASKDSAISEYGLSLKSYVCCNLCDVCPISKGLIQANESVMKSRHRSNFSQTSIWNPQALLLSNPFFPFLPCYPVSSYHPYFLL